MADYKSNLEVRLEYNRNREAANTALALLALLPVFMVLAPGHLSLAGKYGYVLERDAGFWLLCAVIALGLLAIAWRKSLCPLCYQATFTAEATRQCRHCGADLRPLSVRTMHRVGRIDLSMASGGWLVSDGTKPIGVIRSGTVRTPDGSLYTVRDEHGAIQLMEGGRPIVRHVKGMNEQVMDVANGVLWDVRSDWRMTAVTPKPAGASLDLSLLLLREYTLEEAEGRITERVKLLVASELVREWARNRETT